MKKTIVWGRYSLLFIIKNIPTVISVFPRDLPSGKNIMEPVLWRQCFMSGETKWPSWLWNCPYTVLYILYLVYIFFFRRKFHSQHFYSLILLKICWGENFIPGTFITSYFISWWETFILCTKILSITSCLDKKIQFSALSFSRILHFSERNFHSQHYCHLLSRRVHFLRRKFHFQHCYYLVDIVFWQENSFSELFSPHFLTRKFHSLGAIIITP